MRTIKAAAWIRVSSDSQSEENQRPAIEKFCEHHGYEITRWYVLHDVSAWKGEQEAAHRQMLADGHRGDFQILVIWALDRFERRGPSYLWPLIRKMRDRHIGLASVQEDWLNGSEAITDLMLSIASWVAQFESDRKSERVLEGMARAKAQGKQIGGRKAGAKDKAPRARNTGERAGWSEERKAAAAARMRERNPMKASAA